MVAILVTRPAGTADPLVVGLRSRGWRVHAVPTVAIEPVADLSALDAALARLRADDWLILTSATGVRVVAERLRIAVRSGLAGMPKTAAVGPATARAIVRAGLGRPIQPAAASGAALADVVAEALLREGPIRGRRILLARASMAAPDVPDALRRAGADVDDLPAYRTVEGPPASRGALLEALADRDLRIVVLASGSAVRGLVALTRLAGGATGEATLLGLAAVTIGPRTTVAAREAGLGIAAEAASTSVDDLVAAVSSVLAREPAAIPATVAP